jgi:hypothetical protein
MQEEHMRDDQIREKLKQLLSDEDFAIVSHLSSVSFPPKLLIIFATSTAKILLSRL